MIRSVYKGGSSVILPNARDEDYFYYCETNDERVKCIENDTTRNVDNHYKLWDNRLNIFYGCYTYPFMQHIKGEIIKEFATFNICEHKEEYKNCVQHFISKSDKKRKGWYHIYIACMMFENGKNEISDEQKAKAQKVHDNGITEQQYKFIMRVLDI